MRNAYRNIVKHLQAANVDAYLYDEQPEFVCIGIGRDRFDWGPLVIISKFCDWGADIYDDSGEMLKSINLHNDICDSDSEEQIAATLIQALGSYFNAG